MLSKHNISVQVKVKTAHSPHDFFESVRNKSTDIFSPTHNIINDTRFNFIKKGLIAPINKKLITNLKYVQKNFIANGIIDKSDKLFGIPFSHGPYSLLYNTNTIKSAPTSWKIIHDKSKRLKISREHNEANLYIIGLANKIKSNELMHIQKYFADEIQTPLRSLKSKVTYWSGVPTANDFENTDLITTWGFTHPNGKSNWKLVRAKEGITSWIDYLVISSHVKNDKNKFLIAQEWLNFCLSQNYQRDVVLKKLKSIPANLLVRTPYNKSDLEYYYNNLILWPTLDSRTRNGFKKIWDQ
jgi:spermidine/putrescine transport system substrate-binding protein